MIESAFLPPLAEAGFSSFNPADHPRDVLGQFRKTIASLGPGESVHLPDGTTVRHSAAPAGGGFRVAWGPSSARREEPIDSVAGAAALALRQSSSFGPRGEFKPGPGPPVSSAQAGKPPPTTARQATAKLGVPGPAERAVSGPFPSARSSWANQVKDVRQLTVEGQTVKTKDGGTYGTLRKKGMLWTFTRHDGAVSTGSAWKSTLARGIKLPPKVKEERLPPLEDAFAAFDESKHKRGQKGTPEGGRFVVKQGSSGKEVRGVQRKLNVKPDGSFGEKTKAAVRRFQKRHDLQVDGVVGQQTAAALLGHTGKKRAVGSMTARQRVRLSSRGKRG